MIVASILIILLLAAIPIACHHAKNKAYKEINDAWMDGGDTIYLPSEHQRRCPYANDARLERWWNGILPSGKKHNRGKHSMERM